MNSRQVIEILKRNAWTVGRVKGSHHQMMKDGRSVTVPHPKKDLAIGLVRAIFKQAGIDFPER